MVPPAVHVAIQPDSTSTVVPGSSRIAGPGTSVQAAPTRDGDLLALAMHEDLASPLGARLVHELEHRRTRQGARNTCPPADDLNRRLRIADGEYVLVQAWKSSRSVRRRRALEPRPPQRQLDLPDLARVARVGEEVDLEWWVPRPPLASISPQRGRVARAAFTASTSNREVSAYSADAYSTATSDTRPARRR